MKQATVGALALVVIWLSTTLASAQQPAFSGEVPAPGSIGLLVTATAVGASSLESALTSRGCEPDAIAVLSSGSWSVYIPGAPVAVNAGFPEELAAATPFFVRCSPDSPPPSATEAPSPTPSATPTAPPTASPTPTPTPGVTYPQPGAPEGLNVLLATTPISETEILTQLEIAGVSGGTDLLRSVRLCTHTAAGEVCEHQPPPPGTTPAGGNLWAQYRFDVPGHGGSARYTAQLCNANGCDDYGDLGGIVRSSDPDADYYVFVTGFVDAARTNFFAIDSVFGRISIRYSDGLVREEPCTGTGRCGPLVYDMTRADSVSLTPFLLDGTALTPVTLPIRR